MDQPKPDQKNWTWVLERPCPECGFEPEAVEPVELGRLIRANAAAWRSVLGRGDIVKLRPPSDDERGPVWSALEYGAHVRDVYRLFHDRLVAILSKDRPTFPDWNQDRAAAEGRYHEEDPGQVAYALAVAAGEVADVISRVSGAQLKREGVRHSGDVFTAESLVVYLYHDVSHHLRDAEVGIEALRAAEEDADDADAADGEPGPDGGEADPHAPDLG